MKHHQQCADCKLEQMSDSYLFGEVTTLSEGVLTLCNACIRKREEAIRRRNQKPEEDRHAK